MNKKAIILIGISGSGKSTFAKEHNTYSILNKDNIRITLLNSYDSNKNLWNQYSFELGLESKVNELFNKQLNNFAEINKSIIIDNTNLSSFKNEKLKNYLESLGYNVSFNCLNTFDNINYYLLNNSKRINKLNESAINDQFIRACLNNYVFKDKSNNIALVDIDGTVALYDNERSPFEYNKANKDRPNQYVIDTISALYETKRIDFIQFLSGRESYSYELTKKWLEQNGFDMSVHRLLMRQNKDHRKDCVIKAEIFDNCLSHHNIKYLFDDRNQVIDMWWDKKLPVFHVGDYRNVF